jgi:hypothetical protein
MTSSVLSQASGTASAGGNNKPSCMYAPNQTDFNSCVFNALGGAEDQTQSCALFEGRSYHSTCLCTKSKDVYTWYISISNKLAMKIIVQLTLVHLYL